jgi:hypothetical protein
MLEAVAAEIEHYVGSGGWDRGPSLFALVPTRQLASDPAAAALLSAEGEAVDPEGIPATSLTPIEQQEVPDGPLDETLAQIGWPDEVVGCAVCQEIVMLPPGVEPDLDGIDVASAVSMAQAHPARREARLVVAVLRDGNSASILRLRGVDGNPDDLLTGTDLAPNLVAALSETLSE